MNRILRELKYRRSMRRLARRFRGVDRHARAVVVPASGDLTWRCHVCGTERPDAFIDVHQRRRMWPGGVIVTENIRYCTDKQKCVDGARYVYFVNHETDEPRIESELLP